MDDLNIAINPQNNYTGDHMVCHLGFSKLKVIIFGEENGVLSTY